MPSGRLTQKAMNIAPSVRPMVSRTSGINASRYDGVKTGGKNDASRATLSAITFQRVRLAAFSDQHRVPCAPLAVPPQKRCASSGWCKIGGASGGERGGQE